MTEQEGVYKQEGDVAFSVYVLFYEIAALLWHLSENHLCSCQSNVNVLEVQASFNVLVFKYCLIFSS